jgi:hypothetical protein
MSALHAGHASLRPGEIPDRNARSYVVKASGFRIVTIMNPAPLTSCRAGFPDGLPEDSPDALRAGFPDGLPEDSPDALRAGSPDGLPEDSPDALPEDSQDASPADFRVSFAQTPRRSSSSRAAQAPQRHIPSSTFSCLQYAGSGSTRLSARLRRPSVRVSNRSPASRLIRHRRRFFDDETLRLRKVDARNLWLQENVCSIACRYCHYFVITSHAMADLLVMPKTAASLQTQR